MKPNMFPNGTEKGGGRGLIAITPIVFMINRSILKLLIHAHFWGVHSFIN
jgi:hypothetical protein